MIIYLSINISFSLIVTSGDNELDALNICARINPSHNTHFSDLQLMLSNQ